MPISAPRSLTRYCREKLPLMLEKTDGQGMIEAVIEILETDKWNSFDRFHETTATLVRRYEQAGAKAEVYPVHSGGWLGSGRWIIQELADVKAARVEITAPVQQALLDYRENPWHVIQWTSGTPAEGIEAKLVVLDAQEEIDRLPVGALTGKVVLSRLGVRGLLKTLADKGAIGVITDPAVPNNPEALAWTKFGWGAVPLRQASARLVGLVLSEQQGKALRALVEQHGELTLRLTVEVRKYVGTHDVVSGLVRGADDPQDEVWAIAHSAEPGAVDNASGMALCVEIARVLEAAIAAGRLKRPRRTIRLLNGYECYGFFAYLERVRRLQPPLAGVCIDSVGARPEVCGGRLEWHASIPLSAGFAERVGEQVLRAALRQRQPGYRLCLEPFVSTSDTLIGDPHYGYPCPWITTHHQGPGRGFDAYHSSADTVELLSAQGLEACAAGMAGYLHFLADMGSDEVGELAEWERRRVVAELDGKQLPADQAAFVRASYGETFKRLRRWLWGGDRQAILGQLDSCDRQVAEACGRAEQPSGSRPRVPAAARQAPRRTAALSPTMENTPDPLAARIEKTGLRSWVLFYADGRRSIAEIARLAAWERTAAVNRRVEERKEAPLEKFVDFFEAHAELGYVELPEPRAMISKARLVRDLKKLGLQAGMDVMVHSSLSAIGYVEGGADTVIDALLEAIGQQGTLLMPSFNHRAAQVFNPLTTPTTNGAVPDAFWRRREAVRSNHPTHAVAAIGPQAEAYCRDHLEVGIWAPDSPIGRLIHGGGYILALGTTHNTSTAYHVAELSVPCRCIDMFANQDQVVLPDGRVQPVKGLAFRAQGCPVPLEKLEQALDRRRLQRRGKVGQAACALVEAIELWKVRREQVRRVCPSCPVRPAIREG